MESERLLTDEGIKEITKNGRQSLFWARKIAEAQDAKSYQAGRQDAAKEIFEELEKYDATLRIGTAADGHFHYEYKRLSELLKDFKSSLTIEKVK